MRASRRQQGIILLIVLLLSLWGCATPEPVRPQRLTRVEAPAKPPDLEELLVTQVEEKRKLEERLLSFSVKGVDVKEVLQGLAQASELNIVFDPDISGPVTIDLKDVTLGDALEMILSPLGLEYRREKNVIRVKKPALETRIFTLDYVSLSRSGSSSMSVSASAAATGGITTGGTTGTAGATSGGLTGGTVSVESRQRETEFYKDIAEDLKPLLSPQGKLAVNRQSGTVAVTDFPANLRQVAAFLEKVTGTILRQVVINAKVLEVTLSDSFLFGIDWTGVAEILGAQGTFLQRLSPNTGLFRIGVAGSDFSAVIDAISTQGEVNVLSNPRVTALNNQKAVIRVARDDVFFRTQVRTLQDAGQTIERITETIPQVVSIGVILDVTPQIASDGTVTMHIHPIVTDKLGDAVAPTGETAPIVSIRETDTLVRVGDGQTVIIGGLMEDKQDDRASKVPVLGDIPLLGGLFRRTEKTGRKSELVILMSPTVLMGDRAQQTAAEAVEKVEGLKQGIPAWPGLPKTWKP
ncbi:MAG: MSHA biogenesis protein MshL, MSHA biogenesis protein MshL [candidate division NC10 bacterium CSP1-5]|nr:MAG: MSHA biogenesis protein MshL, MSHA biogenesis protein MshL [candidate division NC10 bacterium CSP1-5]